MDVVLILCQWRVCPICWSRKVTKLLFLYLIYNSSEAGRVPHILNNSPPLDMRPKWFGMSTAYTIAKYNMSMCALGMAEEFKGEVAVNTIWPQVPIWTAATQMLYKERIVT